MKTDREQDSAQRPLARELDEEDKAHISEVFYEEIVPKLKAHHARIGAVGCEFAGQRYENWLVHFKETGSDFEIEGFEYDEDACGLDLDL